MTLTRRDLLAGAGAAATLTVPGLALAQKSPIKV